MNRSLNMLKFLGLAVVAMMAIALILVAVANSRAIARLDRKIAALRNAGQPASLADLARKPLAPELNAMTYVRRAQPYVEAIQNEVSAAIDAAPQIDQGRFDEGHLSPDLKKVIESSFAAYPKVLGLLERAGDCPDYDPQLVATVDSNVFLTSILDKTGSTRAVIHVLNYQALVQIADGQLDEAIGTCLLMFRLCRHFDREPTMNNYLVAVVCRGMTAGTANVVLRTGPVSDASRGALEAELARHETDEPFRQALRTERALGQQIYREMDQQLRIGGPFGLPWLKNGACDHIDVLEEVIGLAGRPYAEAERALATGSTVANAEKLTQMIVPALQAMIEAAGRGPAQMRALRILNALASKGDAADGGEPKLSDLGLSAEATTDPFNGKPLHLKKLSDGWLIYAVGKNLTDEGGSLADRQDVGLGPPSVTETPRDADEDEAGSS